MFGKNRNKKVGLCLMVVAASLVLAAVWAALATPETALAKKPGGDGGKPEALHGSATFEYREGDRVQSDGEGPYTYTGSGKGDAILLGLGDFFRLKVQEDKKGVGRRFVLDFLDSAGNLIVDPAFLPENPCVWALWVEGTLAEWRAQDTGTGVLRKGNLYFGQKGWDAAHVSYGKWGNETQRNLLTVTRTGEDVWTIESLAGDNAYFYRQEVDTDFGSGPMPFLITYVGTP